MYNYVCYSLISWGKLIFKKWLQQRPTVLSVDASINFYLRLAWLLHFFSLVWLHVLTTLEIFASCGPEGKGPEFENLN